MRAIFLKFLGLVINPHFHVCLFRLRKVECRQFAQLDSVASVVFSVAVKSLIVVDFFTVEVEVVSVNVLIILRILLT